MKAQGTLLVRADGGAGLGMGHLTRSLALTQAWMALGGRAQLLTHTVTPSSAVDAFMACGAGVQRLTLERTTSADADTTQAAATRYDARYVLVDGYDLATIETAVERSSRALVVFDDEGRAAPAMHTLINQNLHASLARYPNASARLLLGVRYTCLRRPYWHLPVRSPSGSRVLVSFGGADLAGLSERVVSALVAADIDTTCMLGASTSDVDALAARLSARGAVVHVDVADTAALFARADVAVLGAGVSTWEALAAGVRPLLVSAAQNQRTVAQAVASAGAGVWLGDADTVNVDAIVEAVRAALRAPMRTRILDGRGALRVAHTLAQPRLSVRPTTPADAQQLLDWANDALVRAQSFSSAPITLFEHERWLATKLTDDTALLLIGEDCSGRAVGPVRFGVDDDSATISVSVGAAHRGQGLASALIDQGCEELLLSRDRVQRIFAEIKSDNAMSIRAFAAAGFVPHHTTTIAGAPAVRMRRERDSSATTGTERLQP